MKSPSNKSLIWPRSEVSRMLNDNPEFEIFAMQVYRYLDNMQPGKSLQLDRYDEVKRSWIINVAALFIDEGDHWIDYCFNTEYTAILHEKIDSRIMSWLLAPPPDADKA